LTLDAVVAFADGEMAMVSYQRAAAHVARCPQCDAEVRAQVVARSWLRSAEPPAMPTSLLDALRSIPVALPATDNVPLPDDRPAPRQGTGGGHGTLPTHHRNAHRSRRIRFLGTGALVAGLAVGVLVGADAAPDSNRHPDGPQVVIAGWDTP